jgi:cholesterol transport system auxiliary component
MIGRLLHCIFAAGLVLAITGCASVVPDKPVRAIAYDFGPGLIAPAAASAATAAPASATIVLADIETSSAFDGSALLYRLGYADANQLRPYASARWSAAPTQLIRQRLREQLGQSRPVLDLSESAALARSGGVMPRVLRIELEEFSQLFDSPSQSWGLLRLRASLFDNDAAGEKLIGQRNIVKREPAASADASGGVRALAAATDAAAAEISQWLQQTP